MTPKLTERYLAIDYEKPTRDDFVWLMNELEGAWDRETLLLKALKSTEDELDRIMEVSKIESPTIFIVEARDYVLDILSKHKKMLGAE